MLATGLNGFINAQGFPQIGMLTTMLGAALNLILDPVFIFGLDMGVQGAALATIISQIISALWVLQFLTGKKALLTLKRKNMKVDWQLAKQIMSLGASGFIMQGTNCLVQVVCNSTLQIYGGDLYVGVMTVLNSVREVLSLPVSGISSGAQPVLGYNYGAGNKDMIAAMKARDKVRKDAISSLVSAAKKAAIDEGCRDNIPEKLVNKVILKEMKSVKEQIDTCPKERTDLLEEYNTRYAIFEEYAPAMMSAEEIEKVIADKFADVIATKNKGQIMKTIMPEFKGKADGKMINQVVAKLCQ